MFTDISEMASFFENLQSQADQLKRATSNIEIALAKESAEHKQSKEKLAEKQNEEAFWKHSASKLDSALNQERSEHAKTSSGLAKAMNSAKKLKQDH